MDSNITLVTVNAENLSEFSDVICFINPKHPTFGLKMAWLETQMQQGLEIVLLYLEGVKKAVGYIEYIPGEYCWRPVSAKEYLFIHCLWTNGKKHQHQGLGRMLVNAVEEKARDLDLQGTVVMVSDNPFMATGGIFQKMGYAQIDSEGKDHLLVKNFLSDSSGETASQPGFNRFNADNLRMTYGAGLTMVYSRQCPWAARSVNEMKPLLNEMGVEVDFIELRTAEEAQRAPTLYGVCSLIYNGKVLADRYFSMTRLKNILKKLP